MSPSPLTRLAWASLPERAIVARVSNELLRRGVDGSRGEKGKVKDAVRETYPPRGFLGTRYEAVMRELGRQKPILYKRRQYTPFTWSRPSPPRRRQLVAEALLGRTVGGCYDVRVITGHAIYVVDIYRNYSHDTYMVVKHRSSRLLNLIKVARSVRTLAEGVVSLHGNEISRVLQSGGFYTIDVCRMVTTIHPLDGPSFDLHWPIEDEPHPLHRPRTAQCENWA